jgi:hypothetical protein
MAVCSLDDEALGQLLRDGQEGWGVARRVTVFGHAVFVPVTHEERCANLTTANVYGTPTYLNYPFGSPGVAVGRELAFARTSTAWVETGACAGFPILLHDRVIDRHAVAGGSEPPVGHSMYRGENPAMNRYLADRATASAYLVLVYDDFPATAVDWLIDHPADASWILDDVRSTVRFLREQRVVHFDVDLFNVVTEGRHAFIADHGLVLDASFELSDAEQSFLTAHRHFDEGNLTMSFGHQLYWAYRALPADERAVMDARLGMKAAPFETAVDRLLEALADGRLEIDPTLRSLIDQHRSVITYMHDFYTKARTNWNDTTRLDDSRLAQLLGHPTGVCSN